MSHPLEQIADACGLPALRLVAAIAHNGRTRAARVTDGRSDFFLKHFTADECARGRLEGEILVHLNAAGPDPGYRVATCLPARGRPVFELGADCYLLTTWETGRRVEYTRFTPDVWGDLGRTLALLHARLKRFRPSAPPPPPPGLADRLRGRDLAAEADLIRTHRGRARESADIDPAVLAAYFEDRLFLLDEYGPRARAAGADSPDLCARQQVIHNDYNDANFLFPEAQAPPGVREPPVVLDWERAMRAPPEYEVVRCLNHMPLRDRASADRFVRAYVAVRPLDAGLLSRMVDVCLTEQALKHWPAERWLAGETWARAQLVEHAEMVRIMVEGRQSLARYFARAAEES
jgi:Ser/Thr protein kinase RdoA (MazF antagonist)